MGGMTTVFAYGSNLDLTQMLARCPGASVAGIAHLPGHRLAFGGWSLRWGGAVATVVRQTGRSVPGVLYRLADVDLEALDAHEGHPVVYRRRAMSVLAADGRRWQAQVYRLEEALPGRPSAAYLAVLRAGYVAWGLGYATKVFVYGSLLRGEHNHALLAGAAWIGPARTERGYRLVDLGHFPAMITGGRDSVIGEVYGVDDGALARLDELECCPTLYRRASIRLVGGEQVEAYLWARDSRTGPLVPGGDWRRLAAEKGERESW